MSNGLKQSGSPGLPHLPKKLKFPTATQRAGKEAKTSRRFEPRPLNSESRVLTVTPRRRSYKLLQNMHTFNEERCAFATALRSVICDGPGLELSLPLCFECTRLNLTIPQVCVRISGLVVEYIAAIDVAWVRFPAGACVGPVSGLHLAVVVRALGPAVWVQTGQVYFRTRF